jgi:sigma-B regulation protein RsbU (phosphoserine phosphatase)
MSEAGPGADILIVDDERLSRSVLVRTLENAGFACRQASGGQEALALIGERVPDLLLLDYAMPGDLNGAEVCERLRADVRGDVAQLPIIMLTGMSGEEQEVFCLQAGASDFVTKPIHPEVLRARIGTQLRLSMLRRQLEQKNHELADWRTDLERDLEAARLTQQTIIPQRLPVLEDWDLAMLYEPVIQVGGDIYDWLRLPDGRWFFWIADATGHGASAALLTALAKLLFRHAAAEASSPAEILRIVHADFRATFKGRSLLTAMGVAFDPQTGELAMAGAGHPPLFVLRADGGVQSLRSQCPPLGLAAAFEPGEDSVRLADGEGMLLFTDGLYDAVNPAGERMALDAFHDCARLAARDVRRPLSAGSAGIFLRELLGKLRAFSAGQPFSDDLAAVAAFRLPRS